jgi:hypothetical protein
MKTSSKKKTLTFGDFVVGIYEVCGKRKAKGIVQLAVNAHLLEFRGAQRFFIS